MKHRFAAATLTGAFLCVTALAQSTAPTDPTAQPATTPASGATATQPANSEAGNPKRLAPGSLIPVELTRTIDAKKAKTGDQVVAKVTQDMEISSLSGPGRKMSLTSALIDQAFSQVCAFPSLLRQQDSVLTRFIINCVARAQEHFPESWPPVAFPRMLLTRFKLPLFRGNEK